MKFTPLTNNKITQDIKTIQLPDSSCLIHQVNNKIETDCTSLMKITDEFVGERIKNNSASIINNSPVTSNIPDDLYEDQKEHNLHFNPDLEPILASEYIINLDKLCGIGLKSRPYINVLVGNTEVHALADTGSSRTYLNSVGQSIVETDRTKINKLESGNVMLANGSIESIAGEVILPITLAGVSREMTIRIVPELTDECVLGIDFMEKFGIVIDTSIQRLWLAEKPIIRIEFNKSGSKMNDNSCFGIVLLSDNERREIELLVQKLINKLLFISYKRTHLENENEATRGWPERRP